MRKVKESLTELEELAGETRDSEETEQEPAERV